MPLVSRTGLLIALAVIAGLALGVGGLKGYQAWRDMRDRAAESAVLQQELEMSRASAQRDEPPATPAAASHPTQSPPQAFLVHESFSMSPGDYRHYDVGTFGTNARPLRVQLRSTLPVDVGVLATASLADLATVANVGNMDSCGKKKLTSIEYPCVIPSRQQVLVVPNGPQLVELPLSFVIRDSRSINVNGVGLLGGLVKNQTAINNALTRNEVTLLITEAH